MATTDNIKNVNKDKAARSKSPEAHAKGNMSSRKLLNFQRAYNCIHKSSRKLLTGRPKTWKSNLDTRFSKFSDSPKSVRYPKKMPEGEKKGADQENMT